MALLYADEDFSYPVVEELRRLGHDVLTAQQAGQANQGITDKAVLAFAVSQGRALITFNRRHFIRLHRQAQVHHGILVSVAMTMLPPWQHASTKRSRTAQAWMGSCSVSRSRRRREWTAPGRLGKKRCRKSVRKGVRYYEQRAGINRPRHGTQRVWSVVQVPSVADEDRRQLHRDLLEMKAERTQHINRIKGLLASCGLAVASLGADFPEVLARLRTWDGQPVPAELQRRLGREHERWQFVDRQIRDLENERARTIRTSPEPGVAKVRQLLRLRGIGANSAWLFVMELFGWRRIRNRKQLAALVGLTPTPYQSGDAHHEQGISKAGNRRLRTMAVEIAWCWLHYQPKSALSQWYGRRFAQGSSRQRRIGIVALARKLLVALWRFLERGELPAGAEAVTEKKGLLTREQEVAPPEGLRAVR